MSKNSNLSHQDPNQIVTLEHDSSMDAKRVIIVGGEKLDISVDSDKIVDAIKIGLQGLSNTDFSKPASPSYTPKEIQIIEKNVFIPQIEIREIEKQVFIPQIEYRTIEIPVITERIVTIEKPVIIKETEFKEIIKERHYPKVIQICAVIQAVGVICLIIMNMLKK
jgi:hypothetical protein